MPCIPCYFPSPPCFVLRSQSYNTDSSSYTPAVGLVGALFTLVFTSGPEKKPWDVNMGYPTILGVTRVNNFMFAEFQGEQGCYSAASGAEPGAWVGDATAGP